MTEFRKGDRVRTIAGVVVKPDPEGRNIVVKFDHEPIDRAFRAEQLELVERPYVPQVGDIVRDSQGVVLGIVTIIPIDDPSRPYVACSEYGLYLTLDELTLVGRTIEAIEGRQSDA